MRLPTRHTQILIDKNFQQTKKTTNWPRAFFFHKYQTENLKKYIIKNIAQMYKNTPNLFHFA